MIYGLMKVDCPYEFKLDAKLVKSLGSTTDQEVSNVNKIVFRYMGELRDLYAKYCPLKENGKPGVMTRFQAWKLIKDCHLSPRGVTLGSICVTCRTFVHSYLDMQVPLTVGSHGRSKTIPVLATDTM